MRVSNNTKNTTQSHYRFQLCIDTVPHIVISSEPNVLFILSKLTVLYKEAWIITKTGEQ